MHYSIKESQSRQRFVIAHLLGHYLLHHNNNQLNVTVDQLKSDATLKENREANRFASQLLVPSEILRHLIIIKGIDKIETLANIFNVSQNLILSRLKDNKIII